MSQRPLILAAGALAAIAIGTSIFLALRSTPSDDNAQARASPAATSTPSGRERTNGPIIVVARDGVLGWTDRQSWIRAQNRSDVPVTGGEAYRILYLNDPIVSVTGSAPDEGCGELSESPGIEIDWPSEVDWSSDRWDAIAVSGDHELRRRHFEPLDPGSNVYRDAAVDVLSREGIEDSNPPIIQALRVDLDGNGTDEVVIVAEKNDGHTTASPGEYSVMFLRLVGEDGEVRTSVLKGSLANRPPEPQSAFMELYRVVAVADLNGDGRMELAVQSRYYEGSGATVFELKDNGADEVLSVGCGA